MPAASVDGGASHARVDAPTSRTHTVLSANLVRTGEARVTLDSLFTVCNWGVIPAWLLLAFAPSWLYTQRIVHALWIPLLLGCVYLFALTTNPVSPEGGGFTSLRAVMILFTSPHAALAGWVHYLVFDLFVGAWEVRDAQRRSIPHPAVVATLFLTLMFGPIGLLAYLGLRFALTRTVTLDETA